MTGEGSTLVLSSQNDVNATIHLFRCVDKIVLRVHHKHCSNMLLEETYARNNAFDMNHCINSKKMMSMLCFANEQTSNVDIASGLTSTRTNCHDIGE